MAHAVHRPSERDARAAEGDVASKAVERNEEPMQRTEAPVASRRCIRINAKRFSQFVELISAQTAELLTRARVSQRALDDACLRDETGLAVPIAQRREYHCHPEPRCDARCEDVCRHGEVDVQADTSRQAESPLFRCLGTSRQAQKDQADLKR